VNILQENKVSRTEKERKITVGLYNQNILVSNLVVATLNATSQAASERVTVIELFLMSGIAKSSFLKLKVFDDEDNLNPLIEELVQDNTLIKSDF
jgi:hypothetical protein